MLRGDCRMEWIAKNGPVPRLLADRRYRTAEATVDPLRAQPQPSLSSPFQPVEVRGSRTGAIKQFW
jgi:hypothetical protein